MFNLKSYTELTLCPLMFKTPKYSRNSAELGIKCQSINKISFHNKEKNKLI